MTGPIPLWTLPQPSRPVRTAVCYLVRGRDRGYAQSYRRFLDSYRRHPAGLAHDFVLIVKGFEDAEEAQRTEADFAGTAAEVLRVDDGSFDLGAYRDASRILDHDRVCFLNGYSEILSTDWLLKLALNLDEPSTGIVGCTGSFERLRLNRRFRPFPNVHLRSNGFLIGRELFLWAIGERPIREKLDALLLESGPESLTQQVRGAGLEALIVGADARGYPPHLWPRSRTFRLGRGDNLLVGDNQTRLFPTLPHGSRVFVVGRTWGRYLSRCIPGDFAPAIEGGLPMARPPPAADGDALTVMRSGAPPDLPATMIQADDC